MEKLFSHILGSTVAALSLAGFVSRNESKHFLGLMNVDTPHSVLRVPLTITLLYGASTRADLTETRSILTSVGAFYLAMGTAGLVDKRVGGTLPSGLTNTDIVYHFAVGLTALWLGKRPGRMLRPEQ